MTSAGHAKQPLKLLSVVIPAKDEEVHLLDC
jgi:hypothetical protein